MNNKKLFLLLLLLTGGYNTVLAQEKYAVKNVAVIPMNKETVLKEQTVLVENGEIKSLGAAAKIKIPAGYTVIDGEGNY